MKLGQIASTRPDVMPADVITELKKLQDDVRRSRSRRSRRPSRRASARRSTRSSSASTRSRSPPRRSARCIAPCSSTPDGPSDGRREGAAPERRAPPSRATSSSSTSLAAAARARRSPRRASTRRRGLVAAVRSRDHQRARLHARRPRTPSASRRTSRAHREVVRFPQVYKEASSKHVLTLEFFDGQKVDEAVRDARRHGPGDREERGRRRHQDDLRGRLLPRRSAPRQHHHPRRRPSSAGDRPHRSRHGRPPLARAARSRPSI